MRSSRRPATPLTWAWLALLIATTAADPAAVSAQSEPQRAWAVVPYVGFGVVSRNERWNSAGMETAIDVEYGGAHWRWSGSGSVKGLGVGCSHVCFEGGPAVALGGARSVGALWIGGGAGVMKQFDVWRLLPYGRVGLDAASLRFEMRAELLPRQIGSGAYFPIMVGFPIGRGMR